MANYSDVRDFYKVLRKDHSASADLIFGRIYCDGSSGKHLSAVHEVSQDVTDNIPPSTLWRLLDRARDLKATDPGHRIFGIFGLSPAFAAVLPAPDYSRTTSDIFVEVAKASISHSKSLRILTVIHAEMSAPDHPSWAPDWSHPAASNLPLSEYKRYHTARKSKAIYRTSGDIRELGLMGKKLDWVRKQSFLACTWEDYSATPWGDFHGWKDSCSLGMSLTEYPAGETILDALWRTLSWNYERHFPARSGNRALFKEWYDILMSGPDMEHISKEIHKRIEFEIFAHLRDAPLCITGNGLLGLFHT